MIHVWLDDLLPPPEGWVWAKTVATALAYLQTEDVEAISFDHDLGEGLPTGYDLAKYIEEQVFLGKLTLPENFWWEVHSNNTVGKSHIIFAMNNVSRKLEYNETTTRNRRKRSKGDVQTTRDRDGGHL